LGFERGNQELATVTEPLNTFRISCPQCNAKLDVGYGSIGATMQCPSCQTDFTVPTPAELEEPRGTSFVQVLNLPPMTVAEDQNSTQPVVEGLRRESMFAGSSGPGAALPWRAHLAVQLIEFGLKNQPFTQLEAMSAISSLDGNEFSILQVNLLVNLPHEVHNGEPQFRIAPQALLQFLAVREANQASERAQLALVLAGVASLLALLATVAAFLK